MGVKILMGLFLRARRKNTDGLIPVTVNVPVDRCAPSKKWKHKTLFILKDLMFTPFKNLTLCLYRYNFSDVRVLEGVNIKSSSIKYKLCFVFPLFGRLSFPSTVHRLVRCVSYTRSAFKIVCVEGYRQS
jgi:hypothetical protein